MENPLQTSSVEPIINIFLLTDDGLEALEKAIPANGAHPARLQKQKNGTSSYLIAYHHGNPVGHLNVKWIGEETPAVKERVRDCPEINALCVWPPEMRSHGIGRKLITEAETMAKSRGFKHIGLGVTSDNARAKALYEKLGYIDWGHGIIIDHWTNQETGEAHADPCHFLIKDL